MSDKQTEGWVKVIQRMKPYTKRGRSQKSEKELAKRLGGRVQPASGALPVKSLKGDVVTPDWLIDDKATLRTSYSIGLKAWRKIRKQAWAMKRMACIHVNFEEGASLYIIEERAFMLFNELLKRAKV
jgi:hypothetical protein